MILIEPKTLNQVLIVICYSLFEIDDRFFYNPLLYLT